MDNTTPTCTAGCANLKLFLLGVSNITESSAGVFDTTRGNAIDSSTSVAYVTRLAEGTGPYTYTFQIGFTLAQQATYNIPDADYSGNLGCWAEFNAASYDLTENVANINNTSPWVQASFDYSAPASTDSGDSGSSESHSAPMIGGLSTMLVLALIAQ